MSCTDPSCTSHRPPGQIHGVSIGTQGPIFMLATNFEHSNETEYSFDGAGNVVASVIQTEGSLNSSSFTNTTGPIVIFGSVFGSGSGHRCTTFATRLPEAASVCAGGVDVSYRLVGLMTKNMPSNFTIIDSTPGRGYAVVPPNSSTGWHLATLMASCPVDAGKVKRANEVSFN